MRAGNVAGKGKETHGAFVCRECAMCRRTDASEVWSALWSQGHCLDFGFQCFSLAGTLADMRLQSICR